MPEPELKHPQAVRLYKSLLDYTDEKTALQIADNVHLASGASEKKKFEWADSICKDLIDRFDDDTVKKIRMNCACGPGRGTMDKIKAIYDDAENMDRFVDIFNSANLGSRIWIEGEKLYQSYPVCYCSCVKRTEKTLPKAWCYCTLGFTKRMFTYVFGCDVDVQLLESIKSGDERCVISIKKIDD